MTNNYVDNDRLTAELCEWQDKMAETGQEIEMPKFVQTSIVELANGMTTRHNFRNYSWHDDMISDAIFVAWKAAHKFDRNREKGTAVGFLNFCMWRAMAGVIKREKAASDELKNLMMDETYESFEAGEDGQHVSKHTMISMFTMNDME